MIAFYMYMFTPWFTWCSHVCVIHCADADSTDRPADGLSCTDFCLLGQTTCTCRVMGAILGWKVSNLSSVVGQLNLLSDSLNMPTTLPELPAFSVLLTDSSNGFLTAMLSFTVLPEYQGYTIGCHAMTESPPTVTIHIPGSIYSISIRLWWLFTSYTFLCANCYQFLQCTICLHPHNTNIEASCHVMIICGLKGCSSFNP